MDVSLEAILLLLFCGVMVFSLSGPFALFAAPGADGTVDAETASPSITGDRTTGEGLIQSGGGGVPVASLRPGPPPTSSNAGSPSPTPTPTETSSGDGDAASGSERVDDADGSADIDSTENLNWADVTDDEPQSGTVGVATRSRRPMPTRGPQNGTILVSFDGVPVSTISFNRNGFGNVTVAVLERPPPDVADPRSIQLSLLRITVPDGVRNSPAKVVFRVDVDLLEAAGIPNDGVWLTHRAESGEWERLATDVVHVTDEEVTYSATTPGFSLFAIQGDSTLERPSTDEMDDGNGTQAANETDDEKAAASFVGGFGHPMGILLFMGAVSVGVTVFGARQVSNGKGLRWVGE